MVPLKFHIMSKTLSNITRNDIRINQPIDHSTTSLPSLFQRQQSSGCASSAQDSKARGLVLLAW